jgi:hypothetical protein
MTIISISLLFPCTSMTIYHNIPLPSILFSFFPQIITLTKFFTKGNKSPYETTAYKIRINSTTANFTNLKVLNVQVAPQISFVVIPRRKHNHSYHYPVPTSQFSFDHRNGLNFSSNCGHII